MANDRTEGVDDDVTPRVSIGMPVFNGENFLDETIASIRAQTYADFELIISDNASTDATAEICARHAAEDGRIRYVRNVENIGATANYTAVLQLARGRFFKWAAHDDQLAPDFLARSVTALDAEPDAVMCITGARRLDGHRREILRWNSPLHGTDAGDPVARLGAVVRTFYCHWTEIFSVMRRDAIGRTLGHRSFRGSDIAIVAEMALLGRFVRIDEPLFIHREHDDRYYNTADEDPDDCLAWYDPKRRGDRVWHKWALYASHLRAVSRQRLTPGERLRCYLEVIRSMAMWVNVKGLLRDVVWSVSPALVTRQRRLRRRLFGPVAVPDEYRQLPEPAE